ncbi:phosphoglycolate phosphatase [Roseibium hamelinense]|uniref:Phosphoglycolate phosphatase n=1 Tax=Roseibium hamelinense TaxID=150831 RepID=A0A562SFC9_9HYPH|nr:HAD-IA family hydrolase [Roseibium hamelinense]MTI44149.1 HAD family hydrolase [Roseibium hamelinense]TWI80069.1 phosphoglycolate phosphatase [Roseibium hamelinense]
MYLIIFDCDGTLVDSQDTILHGLRVGYEAVGLPMPDRRTALSIVGLSLERAFLDLVGPDHADKVGMMSDAYRAAKVARRQAGLDHDPLYPGTREALDRLSARDDVVLGIATGKARRGVDHLLDVHDLHGRFVTIQTADTSPSKPHPDMIERALSETGVERHRAVMVGDTSFDMSMARAAKTHALGVTWGYHDHSHLRDSGAQMVIDDFEQLDAALAELLKLDREPA